jgi:hypothetical protein
LFWGEIAKCCWTQSEQVKNGRFEKRGGVDGFDILNLMESSIYWFTSHMQRELILIYTEDTVTTKSHAKGVNSYTFFLCILKTQ